MFGNTDLVADQEAMADEQRTKRLFIGFLSSVLGVDQTMVSADAAPASQTGQYVYANPDGTFSQQGQPVSNLNSGAMPATVAGFPTGLVILAGLAYLMLRR